MDIQPLRHKVFISYSHRDTKWLEDLRPQLRALTDQKLIETWDDTSIEPGSKWLDEIEAALNSAKVAVLLVSKHFLTSKFIQDKEVPSLLKAAQENGLVILPVILSPCRFTNHPVLNELQAFNPPSKTLQHMKPVERDELFVKLTEKIEEILARSPTETPVVNQALLDALTLQYQLCDANHVEVRMFHKLLLLKRIAPDYFSASFSVLPKGSYQEIEEWLKRQVNKQLANENSKPDSPASPLSDLSLKAASALAKKEGAREVDVRHFFRALLLDPDSVTIQKLKTAMGAEHFAELLERARTLPFSKEQTNSIVSDLRL